MIKQLRRENTCPRHFLKGWKSNPSRLSPADYSLQSIILYGIINSMRSYEIIKKMRIKAGLTQLEMAKKLKITQGAYGHFETGRNLIPLTRAKGLAKILGFKEKSLLKLLVLERTTHIKSQAKRL